MSSNDPGTPPPTSPPIVGSGTPPPAGRTIKLPQTKQRPEQSSTLKWIAGLIVLAAIVGGAVALKALAADPHYVKAHDSVGKYEANLPGNARDLNDPVYANALSELALVNPKSVSAQPARELAERIRRETARFNERVKKEEQDREAIKLDQARRSAGVSEALVKNDLFNRIYEVDPSGPICRDSDGSIHQHGGEGHEHKAEPVQPAEVRQVN